MWKVSDLDSEEHQADQLAIVCVCYRLFSPSFSSLQVFGWNHVPARAECAFSSSVPLVFSG